MRDSNLVRGDCLEAMRAMEPDTFHACITDPPYEIGFMGRKWDGTRIAFDPETWRLVWQVLKPGAHLLAFGGTRTFHRMAVAIEDAGFELRDTLMWLYGTGFPKSHDVSKGIDKHIGVKGAFGEHKPNVHSRGNHILNEGWHRPWMDDPEEAVDNAARQYLPRSPEAAAWTGWGTALKPAYEPIIVARKPLSGTVAENVLAHGCGALNIGGCRVGTDITVTRRNGNSGGNGAYGRDERVFSRENAPGRWPANVIHDGSPEVLEAFAAFGESKSAGATIVRRSPKARSGEIHGAGLDGVGQTWVTPQDSGTASRFFYSAKASAADRAGSKHPTVKPLALMRYLCKLVTPHGGTVLDPFAGSGSTLQAALEEGFNVVGIEREPQYQDDIARRLAATQPGMSLVT